MKMQLKALAAAAALLATAGAQAALTSVGTPGNSSAMFVALANDRSMSLSVDLGVSLADFLQARTGYTNNNGALAYAGSDVQAQWNFGANSYALNGAAGGGNYQWSAAFNSFVTASGGAYAWGVVAGDNTTGAISANNTVFNRNVMGTFVNLTQGNITGLTSSQMAANAPANLALYFAGSTSGTLGAVGVEGAGTATSGEGFLPQRLAANGVGNFNTFTGFNWLNTIGGVSQLFTVQQASNPVVYQLGTSYGVDTLLAGADAATFSFDGTTLSYQVAAIPEPGTYAMLLAGLSAIGFVVRRRRG